MPKHTKEGVIESVNNFIKENGRIPKRREFSSANNLPNEKTLYKLFGLIYGEFMKEFFGGCGRRFHSKKSILNDVKNFKDENGVYPEFKDFTSNIKLPDPKTIEHHFNQIYSEFMKEYFNIDTQSPFSFEGLSRDDVLNLFKIEYEKIDGTSKRAYDKFKSRNAPSADGMCIFLGLSWNDLKKNLGYEVLEIHYTNEEILGMLVKLSKTLGHTPSSIDVDRHLAISSRTIKDRFGSHNKAIKCAKLKAYKTPDTVIESNEELLIMYKGFCKKIGKIASTKDLNTSESIYNSDVFTQRFGGMSELKIASGFDAKVRSKKYSKVEIIKLLIEFYNEKGRKPTNREIMENRNMPSTSTITRYFRTTSMADVWEKTNVLK